MGEIKMLKLKKLINGNSPGFTNRKFSDSLPESVVKEAAPKMREKPGQKELKSIKRQLERLKSIEISGKHISKLKSAIDSAQKSITKIEKIIMMSSTLTREEIQKLSELSYNEITTQLKQAKSIEKTIMDEIGLLKHSKLPIAKSLLHSTAKRLAQIQIQIDQLEAIEKYQ